MRASLLLLLLCLPCVAEDQWTAFSPSTVNTDNLVAAVRGWYRLSWQGVHHPISADATWEAARVSGDLVLRKPGDGDAVLLLDDGLIELRPLSAEETSTPPSADDLARCAWTITILAMRHADLPLLPTSFEVEATSSGELSLSWETAKNRGSLLRFAVDGTIPHRLGWGRAMSRCAFTCCGRDPSGNG